MPDGRGMSIGEVLNILQPEFPEVTISKIRFLESQGLVEPERTPSGYRKFYEKDVQRLRWILRLQKEQFLPLKVIRQRLEKGELEASPEPESVPEARSRKRQVRSWLDEDPSGVSMSADEVCAAAGITKRVLKELERYGLVRPVVTSPKPTYAEDALLVAKIAARLGEFGVEPRHLRGVKLAADREAGLYAQVVAPMLRSTDPESRRKGRAVLRDVAEDVLELHKALVRRAFREAIPG
ncbi:MAG: MerR family transcriptional regulator [Acidimicrobiales bacterium]|nr:MAG: MerR family transcriptional regulator [Acidimicrobiales bacterium]